MASSVFSPFSSKFPRILLTHDRTLLSRVMALCESCWILWLQLHSSVFRQFSSNFQDIIVNSPFDYSHIDHILLGNLSEVDFNICLDDFSENCGLRSLNFLAVKHFKIEFHRYRHVNTLGNIWHLAFHFHLNSRIFTILPFVDFLCRNN